MGETIDGQRTVIKISPSEDTYYTSADFKSPLVWIFGRATDQATVNTQVAMIRTIQFTAD
jgi:hypothetical protein